MDIASDPARVQELNEVVASTIAVKIRHAGRIGAQAVFFTEDWGTQTGPLIGPKMWRDVFGDTYARLTRLAHSLDMKVIMHSCGYNWILLDDLIDAGIDCFQFDQPAAYDMPALADKFRRRQVCLFSPVDIQVVMPTGDESFIRAEARRLVDTFCGSLLLKNYGDLPGIGVADAWDQWAYEELVSAAHAGQR